MTNLRMGHGYDVHRLTAGRPLILGGVHVPYDRGLDGHSDADVLTHAVMDALLGAAALGDIGRLFPDSDERWRGADSRAFLRRCAELMREHGHALGNADIIIVCERPKVAPHAQAMREHLAADLGAGAGQIGIKATTSEKLGFTGRGEGIAALAVVLLVPNNQ